MKFTHHTPIATEELAAMAKSLTKYLTLISSESLGHNYELPEGSPGLADDDEQLKMVRDCGDKLKNPNLKYVIDIGIGGSNLGAKAVYEALTPIHGNFPRLLFADTNDPEYLHQLATFLKQNVKSADEVVVNVISKSGGTTETIINAEIVIGALSHVEQINDRIVVTTDNSSKMGAKARERGFAILEHPNVGGRYSVLSTVGLFPLYLVGIDVEMFRSGAREARELCLSTDPASNPALTSAIILHKLYEKGFAIHDLFVFHQELESLGKWYRQLTAESSGKEHDTDGNQVSRGLTPTVSVGSTDLHSMVQLYLGGPRNRTTTFVSTTSSDPIETPREFVFDGLVEHIAGRKVSEIMGAILDGTKIAYKKQGLPFMNIVLETISERELGTFMQCKMIEMMLFCKLLGVNAFDQPHVELYKVETKQILAQNRSV